MNEYSEFVLHWHDQIKQTIPSKYLVYDLQYRRICHAIVLVFRITIGLQVTYLRELGKTQNLYYDLHNPGRRRHFLLVSQKIKAGKKDSINIKINQLDVASFLCNIHDNLEASLSDEKIRVGYL